MMSHSCSIGVTFGEWPGFLGSRPRNPWHFLHRKTFLPQISWAELVTTGVLLVPWRKRMKQWTVESFNSRLGWLGRAKAKVALGWWRVGGWYALGNHYRMAGPRFTIKYVQAATKSREPSAGCCSLVIFWSFDFSMCKLHSSETLYFFDCWTCQKGILSTYSPHRKWDDRDDSPETRCSLLLETRSFRWKLNKHGPATGQRVLRVLEKGAQPCTFSALVRTWAVQSAK